MGDAPELRARPLQYYHGAYDEEELHERDYHDDEEVDDEDEDEEDEEEMHDEQEVDVGMEEHPVKLELELDSAARPASGSNNGPGPAASASGRPKRAAQERDSAGPKKKIRRIRPLRSCIACNKRKIKCDRDSAAGCTPCRKRGEGDSCSLLAGLNGANLTNAAIVERLHALEARVDELETGSSSSPISSAAPLSSRAQSRVLLAQSTNHPSSAPSPKRVPSSHSTRTRDGPSSSSFSSTAIAKSKNTQGVPSALPQSAPKAHTRESSPAPGAAAARETEQAALALESLLYTGEGASSAQPGTSSASAAAPIHGRSAALDSHSGSDSAVSAMQQHSSVAGKMGLSALDNGNVNGVLDPALLLRGPYKARDIVDGMSQTPGSAGGIPQRIAAFSQSTGSSFAHDPSFAGLPSGLSSSISTPSPTLMSVEERRRRSTIIVDPQLDSTTHRGQRSLETRARILDSSRFPAREFCDHVVASYFRHLDSLWHVHINWLFEDEYKEFWKLRQERRFLEIDPAWAALFFMTLALGLQVTEMPFPPSILPQPSASPSEILALADQYLADVEELLVASHWTRKPQLRVLQTVSLLSGFQSMTTLKDPTTFTMNGAGVRIAQMLGLHELVDGPEGQAIVDAKLGKDIALPTDSHSLRLQLAKILWRTTVVMELVHVTRVGLAVPLASMPYTTGQPANTDDLEYQSELNGGLPPAAQPLWKFTSTSSLRLRMLLSMNDKQLLDLPADMPASEKYTHVMKMDADLRQWLSVSPNRTGSPADPASEKLHQWMYWSLMADVHGGLVHAHRPYMVRGYTDERFSFSTKTCLESAKALCESWQHLNDFITDQRFWWTSMRYLSAALVIFIDLFHAIDVGASDALIEEKRVNVPLILSILQQRMQSVYSTTSTFAMAAFGVVNNLLEAEKAKKAAALARRNSSDGGLSLEPESTGRVFQRIAQNITGNASPSSRPGSPPKPASAAGSKSSLESAGMPDTMEGPRTASHTGAPPRSNAAARPTSEQNTQVRLANRRTSMPRLSRQASTAPTPVFTAPSTPFTHGAEFGDSRSLPQSLSMPQMSGGTNIAAGSWNFPEPLTANAMAAAYSSNIHPDAYQTGTDMVPGTIPSGMQASYPFLQAGAGHMTDQSLASNGLYSSQMTGQHPPPISWDTTNLFHPDPTVLLQSMGFSSTPYTSQYQYPGHASTPHTLAPSQQPTSGIHSPMTAFDAHQQPHYPSHPQHQGMSTPQHEQHQPHYQNSSMQPSSMQSWY